MNFLELKVMVADFLLRNDMGAVIPNLIKFGQNALERGVLDPTTRKIIVLRPPALQAHPQALSTPVNAAFTSGVGSLITGTYYYRISAIDNYGETLASTETSLGVTGPAGVNINWAKVTGATGYKIYGRATGAELFIAEVGDVATYLDAGSITPAGTLPTVNTTATLIAETNTIPIPTDFIDKISMSLIDGDTYYPPMDYMDSKKFTEYNLVSSSINLGRPLAYMRIGDQFVFDRYADKNYLIDFYYYKKLPVLALDSDTNWWSLNAEQALLYATLVEAIPYLGDDPRGSIWFNKLITEMLKLQKEYRKDGMSTSRENFGEPAYTQATKYPNNWV